MDDLRYLPGITGYIGQVWFEIKMKVIRKSTCLMVCYGGAKRNELIDINITTGRNVTITGEFR